jgi:hypothetical protein
MWFTGRNFDLWLSNGFDNGVIFYWTEPGIPLQLWEVGVSGQINSTNGFGFYIQDEVTLGRFSFMLGLRTDTQKVFNNIGKLGWSWGFGDFLQPRASLSVDISADGSNVLKFGYGRLSMPISLMELSYLNTNLLTPLRQYVWSGPENPTDSQLKNASNWAFLSEYSSAAIPFEIDPELKPNKTDKFLLEFDRKLGVNWALKLRGIYSSSKNQLEDLIVYDPEAPQHIKYFFTNFELKRRDYKAIELELNGKIADRLRLNASYTWSQAKGTLPGNVWEVATFESGWGSWYDGALFGDHPLVADGAPDKEVLDALYQGLGGRGIGDEGWYGFLPYSVNHIAKILATYFAPYGIVLSSNIEYLSGYHWEKKGWSEIYACYCTFPEGRGGRITPSHIYVDLAAEKDFRLKNGMTLALGINAYNILNSQQPVSYAKQDNELFGQVWARQLPRWVQLKFLFRF